MSTASNRPFRAIVFTFAILLGAQSIWLLAAEYYRSTIDTLPTDASSALADARPRVNAARAASIGSIRGDLWAEAAYTYAVLLWDQHRTSAHVIEASEQARRSLIQALDNAPAQSDAWLLLAGLALNGSLHDVSGSEALKMSYYTGPSEYRLMPLRLTIATKMSTFEDSELREMISRELRLLLARGKTAAIAASYEAASPAGKFLIKNSLAEINPSAHSVLGPEAYDAPQSSGSR
jgi:hypothetical protein